MFTPKKPPLKVEYALTPFGETLSPVLLAIAKWGTTVAEEKSEIITIDEYETLCCF